MRKALCQDKLVSDAIDITLERCIQQRLHKKYQEPVTINELLLSTFNYLKLAVAAEMSWPASTRLAAGCAQDR